jgi:hypothetical protein
MSRDLGTGQHPLLTCLETIDQLLTEAASYDPIYLRTGEKQTALTLEAQVEAKLHAVKCRVLANGDDIAEVTGARSTAAWLADQTRDAHGTIRRHAALADALERRWTRTGAAFRTGAVNLAQATVMVAALDGLPKELGDDLRVKAEAYLVEQAAVLGPRELQVLGRGLLEHLAPEIADAHEYRRLLAAERRADAATRLSLRRRGDGSTDLKARIPDTTAGRLTAFLNAFTAPRRHHHLHQQVGEADEFADLPVDRQRGIGFVALLENIPTSSLPKHGGTATTVMVTLDYDTLLADATDAGFATTSTGEKVTAGQARRWACQAGLVPVVLGGDSEILDLGRSRRLVSEAIRKALNIRDKGCTTLGCSMPAAFCEAHHVVPWSRGGKTRLQDCKLLCSFHHHRAHDPDWQTAHHANGKTSFHRRT